MVETVALAGGSGAEPPTFKDDEAGGPLALASACAEGAAADTAELAPGELVEAWPLEEDS